MIELELLSPAKNTDIGIEAIRHGADAVYIGAPSFGARASAGNSVEDIARLVEYAHKFYAKVYVTVNTILRDDELEEVQRLIQQLYDIHVDALIVQDMALLQLDLPPIPLHASTQMDNRTPEKIRFLYEQGFRQAVLARELSLEEIKAIHEACPEMKLEVFVHGALCVSLSGQCYASEALFGRSANRGECAQVCRMEFDLIERKNDSRNQHGNHGDESDERVLLHDKHLLSLKDMCQLGSLQKLIEAGAVSFKIEGRLKDAAYVKNVTAAYSEALNSIVKSMPEQFERASSGKVRLNFQPDVAKSFNRGFTSYFLYGRNDRIFSFDTPKSIGEEVGTVKEIYTNCFTVAGLKPFTNGDGLCFIDAKGKLFGFRLNKIEKGKLYPLEMPRNLQPKTKLYRNFDKKFDDLLQRDSAERFVPVDILMEESEEGFVFTMTDDDGTEVRLNVECQKELARTHQLENVEHQLSKLGGTIYSLRQFTCGYKKNWFIPSSLLSQWRREMVDLMDAERAKWISGQMWVKGQVHDPSKPDGPQIGSRTCPLTHSPSVVGAGYLANVMNQKARQFYEDRGLNNIEWAYERTHQEGVPVMFCRHCIKYALGWCAHRQHATERHGTLYLQTQSGHRFRLDFDCKACMMRVVKEPMK